MVQPLNGKEVKEKILAFLNIHGPSLPVQVSRHLQMNTIFASAFMSEMLGDKTIKITSMKVGGSPLYYTKEKENMLENFSQHLNKKEKEAFTLLRENKILQDNEQDPAIRVALRGIKDFAFPFKKDEKIFWRYYLVSEEEVQNLTRDTIKSDEPRIESESKPQFEPEQTPIQKETKIAKSIEQVSEDELNKIKQELEDKKRELEEMKKQMINLEKKEPLNENKPKIKLKSQKKNPNEEFLEEIKEALIKKNLPILEIIQKDAKQVFAKIHMNNQPHLLAAFNKKKVEDADILKAYKKALLLNLPYYILSKGEPSKKTKEAINAFKSLAYMETLENPEQQDLKTT